MQARMGREEHQHESVAKKSSISKCYQIIEQYNLYHNI
jgi:hypothetical protein